MKLIIQQRPEDQKKRVPRPKQLPVHVQRTVFQQLEKQERNGWFKGIGVVFDGMYILYHSS